MGSYERVKDFFMNRGLKKNMQDLAIVFIIGMIIIIIASFFKPSSGKMAGYVEVKTNKSEVDNISLSYEEKIKHELTETLSQIDGVGKVNVMLYFDSGDELVPAFNQNNSTKVTEENDGNGGKRITNENTTSSTIVTTNEGGGNKPFILKEVRPKISGVIVIAEGADNPEVKYKLYEAVKTVFNIQQYKVNIYPMKKTNNF